MSEHVRGLVVALCAALMACTTRAREPAPIRGLSVSWSAADCATAAVDVDRDILDDRCELALAQAFAPKLVVDRRDCLWREDVSPPRLAGGYLFAAQPTAAGVRIAFLPAYYRDCGWSGLSCALRAGSCGAHAGDSEFIALDVAPVAPGRWETIGVFLSAHCFGRSDGRCRWYRDDDLVDFDWADDVPRGAPQVWVARGKHGHYPSRASCDRGHWFYDSCDRNRTVVRFPVVSERQNVGSRQASLTGQGGCLTSGNLPLGSAGTSPGARECFWDPTNPFWGWQGDRRGAPPASYARYLTSIAAFN